MARKVGQDRQHHHDRRRNARNQTVEPVGEIGAVRYGRDDEDRHQHVENPCGHAVAAREPRIVELVVLDERDRRLRGLDALGAHDHAVRRDALDHLAVVVHEDLLDGFDHLVAHHDFGRSAHHRADDDADAHLSHDLELAFEPLLVVAEDLDVVVQEAQQPQPDGRNDHQLNVDVVQPAEQQHGNQHGQKDHHAAHGGRAPFLELAFEAEVADLLADLTALHEADDPLSEGDRNEQRQDDGQRRAERDVLEHARTGQVVRTVEILEKMIQHTSIKCRSAPAE